MAWLALLLSCDLSLPGMVLGDNPCEDSEKTVAGFAASLSFVTIADLRQGTFVITKEEDNRLSISYLAGGKAVFQQEFSTPESRELIPMITLMKVEGYAALFVGYSFGAGGAISCSFIVFPSLQANGFRSIEVGGGLGDLDADGEPEIIRHEDQVWTYQCPFVNADRPYWHRIFHVSPQRGALVDVSEKFPHYYASRARELQTLREEVATREGLSPACQQGLQELITRVKALATPPGTQISLGGSATALATAGEKPTDPLDQEALNQATEFYGQYLTKCGEFWWNTYQTDDGTWYIAEFAGLHIEHTDNLASTADKLNGLHWHGGFRIVHEAYRTFDLTHKTWARVSPAGQWQPGGMIWDLGLDLKRKDGKWIIGPDPPTHNMRRLTGQHRDCAELLKLFHPPKK